MFLWDNAAPAPAAIVLAIATIARGPVLGAAMASVDDVPRDLEGSFLAKKADVCGVWNLRPLQNDVV